MHGHEVADLRNYQEADAASLMEPALQSLPAGTTLLMGQYTITGFLNCGGFGITYFAKDSLGRIVVIKECFPSDMCFRKDRKMVARSETYREELASIVHHFVEEAHRLASAQHENIVHVHQIFEENDTAYMAMDFIDGSDLLDIAEDGHKKLTAKQIEGLVRTMLRAIRYVHDRGMLHRDISPDNILIERTTGEPVLIDFGAAHEHATKSGPKYSRLKFVKDGYSPQEFYSAGSEQGTWSDLYSFAASIYHLMTGTAPESAQSRLAALAAKKPDPYLPLAGHVTGYPTRFLKTIDQALEVMPGRRIQTADEWLELLAPRKPEVHADQKNAPQMIEAIESHPTFEERPAIRHIARYVGGMGLWPAGAAVAAAFLTGLGVFLLMPGPDVAAIQLTETDEPLVPSLEVPGPDFASAPNFPTFSFEEAAYSTPPSVETTPPTTVDARWSRPVEIASAPRLAVIGSLTDDQPSLPVALQSPSATPEQIRPLSLPVVSEAPQVQLPFAGQLHANFGPPATGNAPVRPADEKVVPRYSKMTAQLPPTADTRPGKKLALNLPKAVMSTTRISSDGVAHGLTQAATPNTAASIPVVRPGNVEPLPAVQAEKFVSEFATLPVAPSQKKLLPVQVVYSRWDVRMPFETQLEKTRSSNTARIMSIAQDADLSVSGAWIEEGAVIYSFNGEPLAEGAPLSAHVLRALMIDADGYSRATVRYRSPVTGILEQGFLAVPVVREIGLADGSVLEARMVDDEWKITVVETGEGAEGFRVGDVLAQETSTKIALRSHKDLNRALDILVSRRNDRAKFNVVRDGRIVTANLRLTRE